MNVTRGTADRGAPPPEPSGTGSLSPEGARHVSRERAGRLGRRSPVLVGGIALFIVALFVVAAATGSTAVLVAAGALVAIVAVFAVIYGIGARRVTARDAAEQPDAEARQAARAEPMPAAFMNAEPDVAARDTARAHDEVNPHDLPPDHPGRDEAARQAGGGSGTTRGDAEVNAAAPERRRQGGPGS